MSSVRSVAEVAGELSATFSGQLLRPADAGYEEARKVHNGLVDKRPALIARCRGTADVVDALNLTRKLGLEVAVRGGGHSVAGKAVTEGGSEPSGSIGARIVSATPDKVVTDSGEVVEK